MLPKLRGLAESFLTTDPDNRSAAVFLAIVACDERDYVSMLRGGYVNAEELRNIVREKNHQGKYIYADHDGQQAPLAHQFGLGWSAQTRKVELPAVILIDTDGEIIEARNGKVHAPEAWAASLEKLVAAHLGLC